MTERENYLRTLEFRHPQWIPATVSVGYMVWKKHRERLEDIVLRHPRVFGRYQKGSKDFDEMPPVYRQGEYFRDNWGCLWYNTREGQEGQVVESPLSDWKAFSAYKPPDPLLKSERGERNWKKIKEDIEEQKKKGFLTIGDGERFFDRLYFLRGFENLMIDIATDAAELPQLIKMLSDYEMNLVNRWLKIGVDIMAFHTDIGTQESLMIDPEKFRRYIKPMFRRIFTACRERGIHVFLSSDGCLLEIVDDLIECGVSMHDPQLRANTLEGIEKVYKGKMCINLDLDRQMIPFCKPKEIREQVRLVVERLGSREGGLMLSGVCGDDAPLENIEALCVALEENCLANMPGSVIISDYKNHSLYYNMCAQTDST